MRYRILGLLLLFPIPCSSQTPWDTVKIRLFSTVTQFVPGPDGAMYDYTGADLYEWDSLRGTWLEVSRPHGEPGSRIVGGAFTPNGRMWLLCADSALYYSDDGGRQHTRVVAPPGTRIAANLAGELYLYLSTSYVWVRSTNAGATWDTVQEFHPPDPPSFDRQGNLYTIVRDTLFVRYALSDRVDTLSSPVPAYRSRVVCVVSTLPDNTVILTTSDADSIYLTTDVGRSWKSRERPHQNGNTWPVKRIVVDSLGRMYLLSGSASASFHSTDTGRSWTQRSVSSYLECGARGDLWDYNGSVIRSNDGGVAWSVCDSNQISAYCQQVAQHGSKLVAQIKSRGTYYSQDYGLTWTRILPYNQEPKSVAFAHNGDLFIDRTTILRTSDGISFDTLGEASERLDADSTGLILGHGLSEDEGNTWRSFTKPPTRYFSIKAFAHNVYAATADSVYRSTDLGETWSGSQLPHSPLRSTTSSWAAFRSKGNDLWLVTDSCFVVSSDSGRNWRDVSEGLTEIPVVLSPVASGYALCVQGNKATYLWDSDHRWHRSTLDTSVIIMALDYSDSLGLLAGTLSNGLYRLANEHLPISAVVQSNRLTTVQSFATPNPARGVVSFQSRSSGPARLEVFNALGVRRMESVIQERRAVEVNLAGWPVGTYSFRISSDEQVETGRFVVLH